MLLKKSLKPSLKPPPNWILLLESLNNISEKVSFNLLINSLYWFIICLFGSTSCDDSVIFLK